MNKVNIPDEAVQAALDSWLDHEFDGTLNYPRMRNALAVALNHLPIGYEVKKLEWSKHNAPNEECRYDHIFTDSDIGKYQIEWKSWKDYHCYTVEGPCSFFESGTSLEDVKAAAQADFERRVRECHVAKIVDVDAIQADHGGKK